MELAYRTRNAGKKEQKLICSAPVVLVVEVGNHKRENPLVFEPLIVVLASKSDSREKILVIQPISDQTGHASWRKLPRPFRGLPVSLFGEL